LCECASALHVCVSASVHIWHAQEKEGGKQRGSHYPTSPSLFILCSDHVCSFSISTGDDESVSTHDVALQPSRLQPVAVLLRTHEHFPAHVAALLGARLLVLEMDASGTPLDEHLGQLHHRREPTVARVAVRDDRREVVHCWRAHALLGGHRRPRLPLLPVVEQLRPEELVDLVWDGVHRVVGDVRPWLVARRRRRRRLPAGDVDRVQILAHLCDLHRVERAERSRALASCVHDAEHLPQLLGLCVGGRLCQQRSTQVRDLLGGVRAGRAFPSRRLPPRVDLCDSGLPGVKFGVCWRRRMNSRACHA